MSERERIERRAMLLIWLLIGSGWVVTMLWIWMMQP